MIGNAWNGAKRKISCASCGREFETTHRKQKYCNPECRKFESLMKLAGVARDQVHGEQQHDTRWVCPKEARGRSGVYFVMDEITRMVKIGYTNTSVESRLSAMQVGSPGKLHLVLLLEGSGWRQERFLHELFDDERVDCSEWFMPTKELLAGILDFSRTLKNAVPGSLKLVRDTTPHEPVKTHAKNTGENR